MNHKIVMPSLLVILVTGCAGAGAPGPALPATSPVASTRETAPVTFTIIVPPRLKTKYVSASTISIEITYSPGNGKVVRNNPGVGPYNVTFDAPLGNTTYTITLYDQINGSAGTGNALATATTSFTVTRGVTNTPKVTLLGIPFTINLALAASPRPIIDGVGGSIPLTVSVLDAGVNPITGTYNSTPSLVAGGGANGLGLLVVGANPATATVSVPDNNTTVNVAYTGGGTQGDAVTYTATANTTAGVVTSNTVTLTPVGRIAFPGNSNLSTITPPAFTSTRQTKNISVNQVNGSGPPAASGCGGEATVIVTQNSPGVYTAAVTSVTSGSCAITLTGDLSQTGTINYILVG